MPSGVARVAGAARGWRSRSLHIVALALLATSILSPIVLGLQPAFTGGRYVAVSVARYYEAADAALILWIDGVKVSSLTDPRLSGALENLAKSHPGVRPVVAVEPDCDPGECPGAWSLLNRLVRVYGWEVAAKAPSTGFDAAAGRISMGLGGYTVVTHAIPGPLEALGPGVEHGARVSLVPLPGIPVDPGPGPMRLYYTVKAGEGSGWVQWLDASVREAVVTGGVVVVYVGLSEAGYGMLSDVARAVEEAASAYGLWVTTPRNLYQYKEAAGGAVVRAEAKGPTLVVEVDGPPGIVTLVVDTPGAGVGVPLVNGFPLPRAPSAWTDGYRVEGDRVIVNLQIPARLVMPLKGEDAVLVPGGVIDLYRGLEEARLAALTIWIPIAANLGLATLGAFRRRPRARVEGASYVVLIPARNASGTIERVVLSALGQTIKPSMVVVLDDSSGDGTRDRVAGLASRLSLKPTPGPRVPGADAVEYVGWARLLLVSFRSHTGKAGMVNRVLPTLPLVEYVMILDSDTILEPGYVEKVLSEMEAQGADAANGVLLLWMPDREGRLARAIAGALRNLGSTIVMLGLRSVEASTGGIGSLTGSAMIVSRKALEEAGGLPEETLAEDAELTWRLALMGRKSIIAPGAIAYTVDPGSLQGVFRKSLRIYKGLLVSTARLLPRALVRLKLRLAVTMVYNSLGGLPITLSLIHLAVTLLIIALGLGEESIAYRLALALPYTPITPLLLAAIENPLLYLATVYTLLLLEATALALVLAAIHRRKPLIRATLSSIKYAPIFPLVLWINAAAMALAIPATVSQLIHKRRMNNKW